MDFRPWKLYAGSGRLKKIEEQINDAVQRKYDQNTLQKQQKRENAESHEHGL